MARLLHAPPVRPGPPRPRSDPPATSLNLAAIAHLAGAPTGRVIYSLIRLEARGLVARRVSTLDQDVSFSCLAGQTDPRAIGEVAA